MPVHLRTIVRDRRITLRGHARIMKILNRRVMEEHLEQNVPLHFREGAENVYHMHRRPEKYLKAKLRIKHHRKPLVWSGKTMAGMLASKQRITATQHKSRLYYKNYFPLKYEIRDEIEIVLQREARAMGVKLRRWYVEHCRNPANQTLRRRR